MLKFHHIHLQQQITVFNTKYFCEKFCGLSHSIAAMMSITQVAALLHN